MDPELIRRICQQLRAKFGLQLPPDSDEETFGRDLLCALHGHPGLIAQVDDQDDEDFDEDEDDDTAQDEDEEEEAPRMAGQLSHPRRGVTLGRARGRQCVAEVCKNAGL